MPAAPSADSALPALKPNQPTQSMPAPVTVIVRLCGGIAVPGKPRALADHERGDQRRDAGVTCTTVPPAKSRRPRLNSQPSGAHTQCATGI